MSLYHEAATFLQETSEGSAGLAGSLKSRVFANKTLKSPPTQLYALLIESTRWSSVLSPIIDKTGLLASERKLTPALSLLLVHDLLISKKGIALPKDHGLRQIVEKHKARLSSELTRARIQNKVTSVDEWRTLLASVDTADAAEIGPRRPRWVRVNTLRSDGPDEVTSKRRRLNSVSEVARASVNDAKYFQDDNVSNLLALPAVTDLTSTVAYKQGRTILQDKASCFPATLLDPSPSDGDIIDACAAPGNKTTHLAALLKSTSSEAEHGKIFAVERDAKRAVTLQKMVQVAGAGKDGLVECLPKQDFMRLSPKDPRFRNVGAILLDPSCSGSGIVDRDADSAALDPVLVLPQPLNAKPSAGVAKGKNGKRKHDGPAPPPPTAKKHKSENDHGTADEQDHVLPASQDLAERLEKLANFQASMIQHAMTFPRANKIVYSTCSIHAEENEYVVCRVLASRQGREWRVLRRSEQVSGMRAWARRGDALAVKTVLADHSLAISGPMEEVADACIRCAKGTDEGTMGFFVVGFVRGESESVVEGAMGDADVEDEWAGFDDE